MTLAGIGNHPAHASSYGLASRHPSRPWSVLRSISRRPLRTSPAPHRLIIPQHDQVPETERLRDGFYTTVIVSSYDLTGKAQFPHARAAADRDSDGQARHPRDTSGRWQGTSGRWQGGRGRGCRPMQREGGTTRGGGGEGRSAVIIYIYPPLQKILIFGSLVLLLPLQKIPFPWTFLRLP